jgi:hypothetical protein
MELFLDLGEVRSDQLAVHAVGLLPAMTAGDRARRPPESVEAARASGWGVPAGKVLSVF